MMIQRIRNHEDYIAQKARYQELMKSAVDPLIPEHVLYLQFLNDIYEQLHQYRQKHKIFEVGQVVKVYGSNQLHVVVDEKQGRGSVDVCLVGATLEPIYVTKHTVSNYSLALATVDETRDFTQRCVDEMMKGLAYFDRMNSYIEINRIAVDKNGHTLLLMPDYSLENKE